MCRDSERQRGELADAAKARSACVMARVLSELDRETEACIT